MTTERPPLDMFDPPLTPIPDEHTLTIELIRRLRTERDKYRSMIDTIHAIMAVPLEWSSDTPEAITDLVLAPAGYTWPPDTEYDEGGTFDNDEGLDLKQLITDLAPYRPAELS